MTKSKTAIAEAPADPAPDQEWHCQLANMLLHYETDRPRANGGIVRGTLVKDFLDRFIHAAGIDEQARTQARDAREQALARWKKTDEIHAVRELEERIREAQAAAQAAHQEGVEAEDRYRQATVSEDESTALAAKRAVLEVQAKIAFQQDRIGILKPKLLEAEDLADRLKRHLLRDAALALRAETEADWDDHLAQLGQALEECLPPLLLVDEVEAATRHDL